MTILDRYAELIVSVGANVQRDQVVSIEAAPDAYALVHRIARLSYERGARYVDVAYFDPIAKRIRRRSIGCLRGLADGSSTSET
jgi:aminopeptidase